MVEIASATIGTLGHCDWVLTGLGILIAVLLASGVRAIRKETRHRRAAVRLKTTPQQRALWRSQSQVAEPQNLLDDLDTLLDA
jgi:hypothetical protein